MEVKKKYCCEYCGQSYDSPVDKAKCVLACAAKATVEEEKRKREQEEKDKNDVLAYVNGLWDKVNEAKKLAENAEHEMVKKYPELARKDNNNKTACNNKFHVSLNGKNIKDEKTAQEIVDALKQLHYIPSFMSISDPLGIWTY